MNYKHSLAALVVASAVSGQAAADANNDALVALIAAAGSPDTTFMQTWAGLDGANTNGAHNVAWGDPAATSNAVVCTWAGVWCDGTDAITHLEVPNAGLTTATMTQVLTALDGIKTQLKVLNVSNTTTPANTLSGDMSALAGFTSLEKLAINNTGATGVVPDLAAATGLTFVNIEENPGITGFAGDLGGAALVELYVKNTAAQNISGDLTATLEAAKNTLSIVDITNSGISGMVPSFGANANDLRFEASGTKLYGTFTPATGGTTNVDIGGTGLLPADPTADDASIGYVVATAIHPVTNVVAQAGTAEGTLEVNWAAAALGAQDNNLVSYSSDNGTTWSAATTIAVATAAHTYSDLATGSYMARVQGTDANGVMSNIVESNVVSVTAETTPAPTTKECPDGTTIPVADTCPEETTKSSGGGGAALYLALLPLMGLLRRKRA